MNITIDEQQRAEIFTALQDRKAAIAKHAKDLTKDGIADAAAVVERRLALYTTNGPSVGLLAMFALQTDLDEERTKAGEVRDPEGQQDIFGGGAETGAGHPAGEHGFLDKFGTVHPTQEEADAANAADESSETSGGAASGVLPFRALNAGEHAGSEPEDADFTIDDGAGVDPDEHAAPLEGFDDTPNTPEHA